MYGEYRRRKYNKYNFVDFLIVMFRSVKYSSEEKQTIHLKGVSF